MIHLLHDPCTGDVDVRHVAEFFLGEVDNLLEMGPVGDIAFEEPHILGHPARSITDESVGFGRQGDVRDDDLVVWDRAQLGECETYPYAKLQ